VSHASPKKIAGIDESNDRFLALSENNCQLYLSRFEVEYRITWIFWVNTGFAALKSLQEGPNGGESHACLL
jgi:hypothetical protein